MWVELADLNEGYARAVREYKQVQSRDNRWNKGPFLVSDDVSEGAFMQWARRLEQNCKFAWEPSTLAEDEGEGRGFCWMYWDMYKSHKTVVQCVDRVLRNLLAEMGALKHVRFTGKAVRKQMLRAKGPDWSLVPKTGPLNAFPYVVFEVAFSNENFGELEREVWEWVDGDSLARLAIGINPVSMPERRMKLGICFMRRGCHRISIPASTAEGRILLPITAEDIFRDVVPDGVASSVSFDFQALEAEINRAVTALERQRND